MEEMQSLESLIIRKYGWDFDLEKRLRKLTKEELLKELDKHNKAIKLIDDLITIFSGLQFFCDIDLTKQKEKITRIQLMILWQVTMYEFQEEVEKLFFKGSKKNELTGEWE